jgi:hypothetical protein
MAQAVRFALAVGFLAAMSAASVADVPKLDVERACREAAKADPTDVFDPNRCIASENEARTQLVSKWASYPEKDRQQCTQMASMGGTASYVELIVCLDLDREVREEAARTNTKPSSMRKK